ncbi:MAG: nicotinate-nucleotide--dimethylbenzimidazole phosphoribosyltransferase [Acidimicrobiales bacterium]
MVALTSASLRAELVSAPGPSLTASNAASSRLDDILRPAGALARLDDHAVWLARWQGTAAPSIEHPVALIFAGDHGVTEEGVSVYPSEVTSAMLAAFHAKKASVSAMASVAGAAVHAIDVGVGRPTGNLRVEAAMSAGRFAEAFDVGRAATADLDADLLILGEMGIGNTTAAAAVAAALLGPEAAPFVGRGTGLDDDALAKKAQVVTDAVTRIDGVDDPLEVLRQVGGTELVAIAGAMVEARIRSIPVLLDGYIATSPALALCRVDPGFTANMRAGHLSAEPGHRLVLDELGFEPLLTLDMRLGEASGAMAAVPLLSMACRLLTDVPTFAEWFSDE